MKKMLLVVPFILLFVSCDNDIKADYDTVRTKKIILVGDDGKDYLLQVKNDSTGKGVLVIESGTK